ARCSSWHGLPSFSIETGQQRPETTVLLWVHCGAVARGLQLRRLWRAPAAAHCEPGRRNLRRCWAIFTVLYSDVMACVRSFYDSAQFPGGILLIICQSGHCKRATAAHVIFGSCR